MNKTGMIASFSLGCMSVGSAWAVDLTLFEQDFLRGKGEPDSYTESFVPPLLNCIVQIKNNGGKA